MSLVVYLIGQSTTVEDFGLLVSRICKDPKIVNSYDLMTINLKRKIINLAFGFSSNALYSANIEGCGFLIIPC